MKTRQVAQLIGTTAVLCLAALASACAQYEPAKPGVYRAPGDATAEQVCAFETPTASRFMQMRCRSPEEARRLAAEGREFTDSIRMPAPDIK